MVDISENPHDVPLFEDLRTSPLSELVFVHNLPEVAPYSVDNLSLCLLSKIPVRDDSTRYISGELSGFIVASIRNGELLCCNSEFITLGPVIDIDRSRYEVVVEYTDRTVVIEPVPDAELENMLSEIHARGNDNHLRRLATFLCCRRRTNKLSDREFDRLERIYQSLDLELTIDKRPQN